MEPGRINDIIDFLKQTGHENFETVSSEYESLNADKPLTKAAKAAAPLNIETENVKVKFELDVSKKFLSNALDTVNKTIPKQKKILKRYNNIQLVSQIIICISSASIFAVLQIEESGLLKYIIPSLTLVSSLLTLYANNRYSLLTMGEDNLNVTIGELAALKAEAELLLMQSDSLERIFDETSALNVIESSNDIAKRMLVITRLYED